MIDACENANSHLNHLNSVKLKRGDMNGNGNGPNTKYHSINGKEVQNGVNAHVVVTIDTDFNVTVN